ncbi:MAG: hypothetical protein QXT86_09965 [Archaeoglobaceae archaeon]
MNLEDFKSYLDYGRRALTILGRRIEPLGTEFDVLKDVVEEVKVVRLAERDIVIPGIDRAWANNIIQGAVAFFRDKVKKDILPSYYAKDDNLIIEPLYRPKIFNLNNFTVNWSGVTPPAAVDLINYGLNVDKELIILTDVIAVEGGENVPELKLYVDGEEFRPVVTRKDFTVSPLKIYELPFPAVADINIRIQARVESASGTFTYLPIGLHLCLGSIHAKTLA